MEKKKSKASLKAQKQGEKPKKEKTSKPSKSKAEKDALVPVLVSVVGAFFFAFPSLGYLLLNETKRAVVYGILSWLLVGVILVLSFLTFGICSVAFIFVLIYEAVVIYDVYLYAKGRPLILPKV